MRHRTIILSAALLGTALALPAAGHPPVDPGRPDREGAVTPDETGCRDVVGGAFVGYQQLIQSIEQEEFAAGSAAVGMYKSRVVTARDKGVATAGVTLAAPSCPDVEYAIEVYNVKTGQLIASHRQWGDGVTGTVDNPLVLESVVSQHVSRSIAVRVTTQSSGVVHDVAPDADLAAERTAASEDGLPPSSGGANSSFK